MRKNIESVGQAVMFSRQNREAIEHHGGVTHIL
jgi:hypothetical protein